MYQFLGKQFQLDLKSIQNANGEIDESKVTIEPYTQLYVFGEKGENLPANACKSFEQLQSFLTK